MKLLNAAGNFFMSTRTEQRVLSIRETEIRPLLFIAPVTTFTVKVAEGINNYLDRHGCKSVKEIIGALEV